MPAMISILKMEPRTAVGTNLAASSIMGISGLIGHIINNNIDYFVFIIMGSSAMIGGYLGAGIPIDSVREFSNALSD